MHILPEYGSVTLGRAKTSRDLKQQLEGVLQDSEVCIIKPNWYSPDPANYTSSHALRMLLEALDRKAVVVEGHSLERQDGDSHYTVNGKRIDWRYVLNHPDGGWIWLEDNIERLRKAERWFLDSKGFTDLFKEHSAEYLNVSEEIWAGRIADPSDVKKRVESRYAPVLNNSLYGFLPKRLLDLEGSTLISFGRVKGYGGRYPSLTLKNLFGLIPDPIRSWWHGPGDRDLSRNIVDVVKVYASYFNLLGLCEAFTSFTVNDQRGEVKVPWGAYSVAKSDGFYAMSSNLVELDAVLCGLIKVDPTMVGYLELARRELAPYSEDAVQKAVMVSSSWLPYGQ